MTVNKKSQFAAILGGLLTLTMSMSSPAAAQTTEFSNHPLRVQPAPSANDIKELEEAIFTLANQARVSQGLPALAPHPLLFIAARKHSEEMNALDYFDHVSPVSGRTMPWDRVDLTGLKTPFVSENLYDCEGCSIKELPELTVQAWMHSPVHRANLLDKRPLFQGIGIVVQGDHFMVTEVFSGADEGH